MEVYPGVHQLKIPLAHNPMGHLNAYLLEGRNGWLLVDAGWNTPDAFSALEGELRGMGLGFAQISQIVFTHLHPDHYGLAGKLKRLTPALQAMHHLDEIYIEARFVKTQGLLDLLEQIYRSHGVPEVFMPTLQNVSMAVLGNVDPAPPDIVLQGGEVITAGKFTLEVLWTPGHSLGHVCLYEREKRLLFSGDHILPTITPIIGYHPQSGDNPLRDYIRSLEGMKDLAVDLVLPGHEYVFFNLKKRVEEILDHHQARKRAILDTVREVPRTTYDIASRIPWETRGVPWEELNALERRSAVVEALAHIKLMLTEGRLEESRKNGVLFYRARKDSRG